MVDNNGTPLDTTLGPRVDSDGWLTLAEASAKLGISMDAARRRMRRGELQRRQIRTRHGITWQVRLEPPDPGTSLAPTVVPTVAIEPTVQALLEYLRERDRQRDGEVAQLREELARSRADLVDHAGQLAEAREQLRALQAPTADSSEIASGRDSEGLSAETAQQSTDTAPRTPWWRRWLLA
jgi:hypothetical protein